MAVDSVLLIGFGGPGAADEIRPFLQNVVRGRNVPPERVEEVAHHYEAVGGRSPYNELTLRQAEALRARLAAAGIPLPVYVAMRNWHPYLKDTIATMAREGRRHAAGVILAAHRSPASDQQYRLNVEQAREANGGAGPEVTYLDPWHTHPLFLEAQAARIEAASGYARGAWPEEVPLLFTAHSIPASMARVSRYEAEIAESSSGVAALLGAGRWPVAYQSRSGDGRVPWLEPDVNDVIRDLAAAGARELVIAPVGFLCDHVEVLYDLDIEARETAAKHGARLVRAGTVGDHPAFITMLEERITEQVKRQRSKGKSQK
jgi:protoporphyrin/coproporphyrin ferrochelatase